MYNMSDEDIKVARALGSLTGISVLAATVLTILNERDRTLRGVFSNTVLAWFSGLIVGLGIHGWGLPVSFEFSMVSIAAISARPLLVALLNLAQTIKDNPRTIFDFILSLFKRNGIGK